MKKIIFIITLGIIVNFAASSAIETIHPAKKDTIRDIKNKPKPHAVKGKSERMRMQLRQIKYHDKQLKKADSAQKKVKKGERPPH